MPALIRHGKLFPVNALSELMDRRSKGVVSKDLQLNLFNDYHVVEQRFKLVPLGGGGAEHIFVWSQSPQEAVVLYFQGYVAEAFLPPVTSRIRYVTLRLCCLKLS